MTIDSESGAQRWLSLTEADMIRGTWDDPLLAGEVLDGYAERWIDERPGLLGDRGFGVRGGIGHAERTDAG